MEKNYIKQADNYLKEYEREIKKRNLRQASEKLWGAASQIVKAYAEKKRWAHNGHRELFKVVSKISKETGDEELKALFSNASALHTNFYEGWFTKDEVETNAKLVKKFVDKIKILNNKKSESRHVNRK
jgi:hypothetical protein